MREPHDRETEILNVISDRLLILYSQHHGLAITLREEGRFDVAAINEEKALVYIQILGEINRLRGA